MPKGKTMTFKGQTTRSLFRNMWKGIKRSSRYSTIKQSKTRKQIRDIAYDILNTLSGGEPMVLLNETLDRDDKMKIEPLKTACNCNYYLSIISNTIQYIPLY